MEIPNVLSTFTADLYSIHCKLDLLYWKHGKRRCPESAGQMGLKITKQESTAVRHKVGLVWLWKLLLQQSWRSVAKGTPGEYFKGRKTQRTCNAMSNGWLAGKNRVGEQGPALLIVWQLFFQPSFDKTKCDSSTHSSLTRSLTHGSWRLQNLNKNIARGTTDPGYWLFNLSYLSS